jgi:hypothetical protein
MVMVMVMMMRENYELYHCPPFDCELVLFPFSSSTTTNRLLTGLFTRADDEPTVNRTVHTSHQTGKLFYKNEAFWLEITDSMK